MGYLVTSPTVVHFSHFLLHGTLKYKGMKARNGPIVKQIWFKFVLNTLLYYFEILNTH